MYVANLLKSITTIKSVRGVYALPRLACELVTHATCAPDDASTSPSLLPLLIPSLSPTFSLSGLSLSSRVFANVAYAVNSLPPGPSMLPLLLLLPFSFWQQAHKIFYTLLLACPFWHGLGQRLCSQAHCLLD